MELSNAQKNPHIPQKMTKDQKCAKENCTWINLKSLPPVVHELNTFCTHEGQNADLYAETPDALYYVNNCCLDWWSVSINWHESTKTKNLCFSPLFWNKCAKSVKSFANI